MMQPPHHIWTYDVFLNFRGTDTRNGFTGNLYNALHQRGINTFFDKEGLQSGEEINSSLFKAIKESRIAILVFSKNYASSAYCLNELVLILKCLKEEGRSVLPIFYDVEPTQVRYQKGSYGEALAKHEKRYSKEKLQEWKSALFEAANLSGWSFKPGNGYEYEFIGRITKEVSIKINRAPLDGTDYPVGLESRVLEVISLLDVESINTVSMVGIHGIGGIGKTTIARAVYNFMGDQFECVCFLNVRTIFDKHGMLYLQETLLFELVGEKDIKLGDVNKGVSIIKSRLHQKKVLIVLDDVDAPRQLKALAGDYDWFGSGSRIIITTRNKHLLAVHGVKRMYEVHELNGEEALQLFSWKAFKEKQVPSSYLGISERVVSYCSGLPLALEVIGSNFYGKGIEEWNSALEGYERAPDKEIFRVLKISYDTLDDIQKEIFLVACFFKGKKLEYVKDMLRSFHGITSEYAIGVLIDRSLIKIEYGRLTMHDLVQDMGREIIQQASPGEPDDRSRLWSYHNILHVLQENTIMARKFDMIKEIDNSRQIWKLAVRIVDLWSVQPQPPQQGHLEMVLMDAKGDKIQVGIYKDEMAQWKPKLKEQDTYIMQNFNVVFNDLRYKVYDHAYRMYFISGTTLKEHPLPEVPAYEYQFKNYGDILSGNYRADLLVDVIGVLHEVIFTQSSGDKKRISFTMRDLSGEMLSCTLWKDHAMKLWTYYNQRRHSEAIIIILTHARIKEQQGQFPIYVSNSWYGSKLLINEDVLEIQNFKKSLSAIELPEPSTQRLTQMSASSQFSQRDRFMYNAQVKTISDINSLKEEMIYVTVGTTGEFVVSKNGWSYEGCMNCTKRAKVVKGSFKCQCGHFNEHSVPRYKLVLKVFHKKASSNFIFWDIDCHHLIGNSAVEVQQLMLQEGEDDPKAYPAPLDRMLARTLAFRIRVQPGYNNCSVIKISEDAELIQSILSLFESEEEVSKLNKLESDMNEEVHYDTQSLSATADHDPELSASITPAKRILDETQLDDRCSQDMAPAQLSSTKMTKKIKSQ